MNLYKLREFILSSHPGLILSTLSISLSGLWLLNPWFATFAQNKAWDFMASVAAEKFWGGLFLATGLISLLGWWQRNDRLFRFGLLWVVICRAFLLVAFTYSSKGLLQGVPEYLSWFILASWVYLRVGLGQPPHRRP